MTATKQVKTAKRKKPFRRSSRGAVKHFQDGTGKKWDSKWEYDCWLVLCRMQDEGYITELRHHEIYEFKHNGVIILTSEIDFEFRFCHNNEVRVADAKSVITASIKEWRITKQCFKAFDYMDVIEFIYGETDVEILLLRMIYD